ncbi:MAG: hypothetical protein KGD67_12295, partial [Candidatus Lokiarchaeota archaeon]|nr:hypothetical protein [Candidatus Lokiarchaeota archaeon]
MRVAIKFAYDGRRFYGFARQPGLKTVEEEIIKNLKDIEINRLQMIENKKKSLIDVVKKIKAKKRNQKKTRKRKTKKYLPRDEEGSVEKIFNLDQIDLHKGNWLILSRTGSRLMEIMDLLKEKGIY